MQPGHGVCPEGEEKNHRGMNGKRQNRTPGPPFLKIGRKVLYLADDLDAWLLEHRHEG